MNTSMNGQAQLGEPAINWHLIIVALLVISPLALGVHSYMLDVKHIPFPQRADVPTWPRYINEVGSTIAYIIFYSLVRGRLDSRFSRRLLIVAAIYSGLRATLRLFLINSYLTGAWVFQGMTTSVRLIEFAIIVTMILLATPLLRTWWLKLFGGILLAAVATFVIKPGVALAFAPTLQALSALDYPEFRLAPYTAQDNFVIYGTYLETTLACFAIAYLSWPSLSRKTWVRTGQFAALILFMKQSLVPTFLYFYFEPLSWPQAMLSESQFTLEVLTLAVMTALIWPLCYRPGAGNGAASEARML